MSDTQWPRYEVFIQERPGEPHRNIGSVHAPDPEIALLNAKDVFVRRPNCQSIWVAPAERILAKTSQELADPTWRDQEAAVPTSARPEPYYVFQKQTQKPSDTYVSYVGQVEAASPAKAMQQALAAFNGTTPWVWWVCPARYISRSDEDDVESMFEPAREKHYRHQYFYHTVAQMHELKKQREEVV